jgi:4-amino-4-deoxy-L-arabinose transferase-like glycosyltransferase
MLDKTLRWLDTHLQLFLLLVCVLRIGFLFSSGLVLVGDESYYWDWSRQPDWCYFSKPPMVAWLIGSVTWLLGDFTPVLRLPAVLLSTICLGYFYATAKAFYGARAAGFALLLLLATPNNVLANIFMTIDPPLYCFWMMCVYYLQRGIFSQDRRAWWWAGCAGAMALLSKQVAIALPLLVLLFILLDKQRYKWLKKEFLCFLLPMMLATLPLLLWNRQHDWVMFGHVKSHFTPATGSGFAFNWHNVYDYLFQQLLLISPVLFGLVVVMSVQNVLNFKRLTAESQFLLLFGPLLVLGVLLLSFKQKVQGNWPMPFYFTALVLLAGMWQNGRWKKIQEFALSFGLVLVAVTYLLPVLLSIFQLQESKFNPLRRFGHWQELAANIQIQRQQVMPQTVNCFVLALGHRNLASEMAFYLPDHPKVFRYETEGAVVSQYEVWPGPQEFLGGNALIISDNDHPVPAEIKSAFQSFRFVAEVANPKQASSPFYLSVGENLQHWPSPVQHPVFED